MLIDVSEREAFLVHQFRAADVKKKSAVSLNLYVPLSDDEIREYMNYYAAEYHEKARQKKEDYLCRCKETKKTPSANVLLSIQKTEAYDISSLADSVKRMNEECWLKMKAYTISRKTDGRILRFMPKND